MNVIRYSSFTEFYNDFKQEFGMTSNGRLAQWWHNIGTLNQGCGCTRRQRMKMAYKEYLKSSLVLNRDNVNLMRMKNPNTTYEFADGDGVFWKVLPKGNPFPNP